MNQAFTVNLTIVAECVVGAGTNITFPEAGYLTSMTLEAQGSFVVGCTKGTTPTITLNNGLNNGSCPGTAARCMRRGTTTDYVNYDLYTNSGRTTAWTSALATTPIPGSGAVTGTTPDKDRTVDVYGRVPPQNTATPGAYTDTVTATVTF